MGNAEWHKMKTGEGLWLFSEIIGRNPAFPTWPSSEDLAKPPATGVLLTDFKQGPFFKAAGFFISFKICHCHIKGFSGDI